MLDRILRTVQRARVPVSGNHAREPFTASLSAATPAPVFEISHQFLLLGINRDHRLIESDVAPDFAIDVLELSIAVRMRVSFLGLPVGLQAVPQIMQQLRDHWIAHPMSHPVEVLGQFADAVAGPAQTGFQHLYGFGDEANAAEVRQTRMITGDSKSSGRKSHSTNS